MAASTVQVDDTITNMLRDYSITVYGNPDVQIVSTADEKGVVTSYKLHKSALRRAGAFAAMFDTVDEKKASDENKGEEAAVQGLATIKLTYTAADLEVFLPLLYPELARRGEHIWSNMNNMPLDCVIRALDVCSRLDYAAPEWGLEQAVISRTDGTFVEDSSAIQLLDYVSRTDKWHLSSGLQLENNWSEEQSKKRFEMVKPLNATAEAYFLKLVVQMHERKNSEMQVAKDLVHVLQRLAVPSLPEPATKDLHIQTSCWKKFTWPLWCQTSSAAIPMIVRLSKKGESGISSANLPVLRAFLQSIKVGECGECLKLVQLCVDDIIKS